MNTGRAARKLQTYWVWQTATWLNAQTPRPWPGLAVKYRLQCCPSVGGGALGAAGYRASREAHHYRVLQSLAYTLKTESSLIVRLDKFRKKRNIGEYERAGVVSDQEAKEMVLLAKALREEVENWLRSNFPDLM